MADSSLSLVRRPPGVALTAPAPAEPVVPASQRGGPSDSATGAGRPDLRRVPARPIRLLLVEDSVTAIVQVDGKVRDKLEVSPTIGADELEALASASAAVQRAVGDKQIANVIVRAPRVVNIATAR